MRKDFIVICAVITIGLIIFALYRDSTPDSKNGRAAFAQLQAVLTIDLLPLIQAQGILGLNMPTKDTCSNEILDKVLPILTSEQKDAIWSDPVYGMGSGKGLSVWIQATKDINVTREAAILRDHFNLSRIQTLTVLRSPFQDWIANLDGIYYNWWQCSTSPCDPLYIGALQWSQQAVTMNPPETAIPFSSVASINSSLVAFPEISYYLREHLLKNNFTGNISKYQSLTFTAELGMQVMNEMATQQSLIDKTNYDFVLTVGVEFEKNGGTPDNLAALTPIQERWNLTSLEHAYVFYKYCEYLNKDSKLSPPTIHNAIDSQKAELFLSSEQQAYKEAEMKKIMGSTDVQHN